MGKVKALVKNGTILGMGMDDAAAREDALRRRPEDELLGALQLVGAECVDATAAALEAWNVDLGDYVTPAPDGTVRRIDIDDVDEETRGTWDDPAIQSDGWAVRGKGIDTAAFVTISRKTVTNLAPLGKDEEGRAWVAAYSEAAEQAIRLASALPSGIDVAPFVGALRRFTVSEPGETAIDNAVRQAASLSPAVYGLVEDGQCPEDARFTAAQYADDNEQDPELPDNVLRLMVGETTEIDHGAGGISRIKRIS